MRGEYRTTPEPRPRLAGSPPLARGIQHLHQVQPGQPGITPACAGNTCNLFHFCNLLGDHPRLRGEYYKENYDAMIEWGSPPLARGIHPVADVPAPDHGITPACAGNTDRKWLRVHGERDHPRLRGEYSQHFPQTSSE